MAAGVVRKASQEIPVDGQRLVVRRDVRLSRTRLLEPSIVLEFVTRSAMRYVPDRRHEAPGRIEPVAVGADELIAGGGCDLFFQQIEEPKDPSQTGLHVDRVIELDLAAVGQPFPKHGELRMIRDEPGDPGFERPPSIGRLEVSVTLDTDEIGQIHEP